MACTQLSNTAQNGHACAGTTVGWQAANTYRCAHIGTATRCEAEPYTPHTPQRRHHPHHLGCLAPPQQQRPLPSDLPASAQRRVGLGQAPLSYAQHHARGHRPGHLLVERVLFRQLVLPRQQHHHSGPQPQPQPAHCLLRYGQALPRLISSISSALTKLPATMHRQLPARATWAASSHSIELTNRRRLSTKSAPSCMLSPNPPG